MRQLSGVLLSRKLPWNPYWVDKTTDWTGRREVDVQITHPEMTRFSWSKSLPSFPLLLRVSNSLTILNLISLFALEFEPRVKFDTQSHRSVARDNCINLSNKPLFSFRTLPTTFKVQCRDFNRDHIKVIRRCGRLYRFYLLPAHLLRLQLSMCNSLLALWPQLVPVVNTITTPVLWRNSRLSLSRIRSSHIPWHT